MRPGIFVGSIHAHIPASNLPVRSSTHPVQTADTSLCRYCAGRMTTRDRWPSVPPAALSRTVPPHSYLAHLCNLPTPV